MTQETIIGLGLIIAITSFLGMCWWAFSARNKQRFEDAGTIPFLDEEVDK